VRLRTIALTALLVLMTACSPIRRENVILIVVDTLRADHLSLAGYARATSPRLAEYAPRGTYFDRFHSHSSWTRPSVATILTSLMPRSHGIVTSGDALSRAVVTLPEALRIAGYDTLAFVANPQIHPALGFDQGFESFFDLFRKELNPMLIVPEDIPASATDAEALAKTIAVLRAEAHSPFFAYVHLLDPHGPYTPDAADAAEFAISGYRGPISGSIHDFAKLALAPAVEAADLAQFKALYDAEIRGTDRDLGAFLDDLDRAGMLANTHVLVTSDHGEEFLEHGGTGHGRKLHEEQIHVPLLWIGPGVPRGKVVHDLAGLVDLAPTLIDLLGVRAEGMKLEGRSLRPLWEEGGFDPERTVLLEEFSGELAGESGRQVPFVGRGLLADARKLLVEPYRLDRQRGGRLTVFDLAADPGERAPRTLAEDPARWSPADAALVARWVRLDGASTRLAPAQLAPPAALPEEDRARLRSLGYLD